MAKKKKRALPLVILVGVLLLIVASYLAMQSYNKAQADKQAESELLENAGTLLIENSTSQVQLIRYSVDGEQIELVLKNDVWHLSDDEKFPVDKNTVDSMAQALLALGYKRSLESDTDTSEFGIEDSTKKVYFETADGRTHTYTFGSVNSFNSQTYLDYNGTVYMIEDTVSSLFTDTRDDLIHIEDSLSGAKSGVMSSITLVGADGESCAITDTDGMDALLTLIDKHCDFKSWSAYGLDEETLAEYGITADGASAVLKYKASSSADTSSTAALLDATVTVLFGEADGKYYYTLAGSDMVYTVKEEGYVEIMEYLTYTAPETTAETAEV